VCLFLGVYIRASYNWTGTGSEHRKPKKLGKYLVLKNWVPEIPGPEFLISQDPVIPENPGSGLILN
jgi:hypothetical protein